MSCKNKRKCNFFCIIVNIYTERVSDLKYLWHINLICHKCLSRGYSSHTIMVYDSKTLLQGFSHQSRLKLLQLIVLVDAGTTEAIGKAVTRQFACVFIQKNKIFIVSRVKNIQSVESAEKTWTKLTQIIIPSLTPYCTQCI